MIYCAAPNNDIWCHNGDLFCHVNTLQLRQNGCYFADGIFKCIFLNKNNRISNTIWLQNVLYGLIGNMSALVYRQAISEPMTTQFIDAYIDGLVQDCANSSVVAMRLLQSCTKPSICVTWPHWVNFCHVTYIPGHKKHIFVIFSNEVTIYMI